MGGDIGEMRIEARLGAFERFGMTFVIGIGDCLQEVCIARRSTDILGRSSPSRFDQSRIEQPRHGLGQALDLYKARHLVVLNSVTQRDRRAAHVLQVSFRGRHCAIRLRQMSRRHELR